MSIDRKQELRSLIFEITEPRAPGEKAYGAQHRYKLRQGFTSGELAVIEELYRSGATSIRDLSAPLAARVLESAKLVESCKRITSDPVLGTFTAKRMELSDKGLEIAEFLYPTPD